KRVRQGVPGHHARRLADVRQLRVRHPGPRADGRPPQVPRHRPRRGAGRAHLWLRAARSGLRRAGSQGSRLTAVAGVPVGGADTREVSRDPTAPTGVALVMVDAGGEKQILTAPGANRRLAVRDVAHAGELIANARVVLLQLEVPLEAVEAAIRLARAAGARVV